MQNHPGLCLQVLHDLAAAADRLRVLRLERLGDGLDLARKVDESPLERPAVREHFLPGVALARFRRVASLLARAAAREPRGLREELLGLLAHGPDGLGRRAQRPVRRERELSRQGILGPAERLERGRQEPRTRARAREAEEPREHAHHAEPRRPHGEVLGRHVFNVLRLVEDDLLVLRQHRRVEPELGEHQRVVGDDDVRAQALRARVLEEAPAEERAAPAAALVARGGELVAE